MNMKLIKAAAAYYSENDPADAARIDFFMPLWEYQAERIKEYADAVKYEVADLDAIAQVAKSGQPIFEASPVAIDADCLVADAANMAELLCQANQFEISTQALLRDLDWNACIKAANVELAAAKPADYLGVLDDVLHRNHIKEESAHIAVLIVSMALRCQLEAPAAAAVKALREAKVYLDLHPLSCPVCGSAPAMSHVGGETSSQGRGRVLVCSQCGTTWEFQRVRCACCGNQTPQKLHFFNIEGDDMHRIATCDDCGGVMRSIFSDEDPMPVSYEVEDVVMTKLNALAATSVNA